MQRASDADNVDIIPAMVLAANILSGRGKTPLDAEKGEDKRIIPIMKNGLALVTKEFEKVEARAAYVQSIWVDVWVSDAGQNVEDFIFICDDLIATFWNYGFYGY